MCYAGPRVVRVDGAYSEVFTVDASIVAGCAGATTLLKAVLIGTCDEAAAASLRVASCISLSVVVDDITVQGVSVTEGDGAAYERFEQDLASVVGLVSGGLEGDVGGTVSDSKTVLLASSEAVGTRLAHELENRWSPVCAARNLGVDFSYQVPSAATQAIRAAQAQARSGRFAFLRRFGGQVVGVVRAGPRASVVFGSRVQGASEAALAKMRTAVGACAFGPLGGASLTLQYVVAKAKQLDPVFDATLQPLLAWATACWEWSVDVIRRMAVVFAAAQAAVARGANLASYPPGPSAAVLTALDRIGWVAEDFQTWVTDRGVRLHLRLVCPRSVRIFGQLAVERWQWKKVGASYPDEFSGLSHGCDPHPVRAVLGKSSPLTQPQQQLVKCAVVRRLWPDFRRASEGYQESGTCAACGEEHGTLRHALFRCPAVAMDRHCADLGPVGSVGARSAAEHHLFSRGLMGDLRHLAPPPKRGVEVHWDPRARCELLTGHVFLDGSRYHGGDVLLARAGWGVAAVRVVGVLEARAWGPFPGLVQCIDAAEVFAAVMALRLGMAPLVLYSDSGFFVDGFKRGYAWCVHPGRAHADIWKLFWSTLDDFGGPEVVQVVKVKGHATQAMVESGAVSEVDKFGNDMADEAAKWGAACHPSVAAAVKTQAAGRAASRQCLLWMGVGLEAAQKVGALPEELTAAQKQSRPRKGAKRPLDVIADDVWKAEQRAAVITQGAHPTHDLRRAGRYYFCSVCGAFAAARLGSLREPCVRHLPASRTYRLRRLLDGRDPRTGEPLSAEGGHVRAAPAQAPLHASIRR